MKPLTLHVRRGTLAKAVPPHLIPTIKIRRDGHRQTYYTAPPDRPNKNEVHVDVEGDKLVLDHVFDRDIVKRIKKIPGRRFDGRRKVWTIPIDAYEHAEAQVQHLALTDAAAAALRAEGYPVEEGGDASVSSEVQEAMDLERRAKEFQMLATGDLDAFSDNLVGSYKQNRWARSLRAKAMLRYATSLLQDDTLDDGERFQAYREAHSRAWQETTARYWIDSRNEDLDDIIGYLPPADVDKVTLEDAPTATGEELDEDGFPVAEYDLDDAIIEKLYPEQVVDTRRVMDRWSKGQRGMVLANGTGTGKTYVYAAAIAHWHKAGKKVRLFVPNQDLIRQTTEALDYMGVPSEAYDMATYAKLRKMKPRDEFEPGYIAIFDEAHKIKKMYGDGASSTGRKAKEAIEQSEFALFSTATPFEGPGETEYLRSIGIQGSGSFTRWLAKYGVTTRPAYRGDGVEYVFTGEPSDLRRMHEDLTARGYLTKRVFEPEAGLVEGDTPSVEIGEDWAKLIEDVGERLQRLADGQFGTMKALIMARRTMFMRSILERAKVEAALPVIQAELDRGNSVAVFTQYRSDREMNYTHEDADEAAFILNSHMARRMGMGDKIKLMLKMALAGITQDLPSPTESIADAFPGAMLYTGAETKKELDEAKRAFNEGEAKLLVLTGAKGGTGLSFHDTTGDRPTSQIVLTLPWSSTELDQMLGRAVRKGLASKTRIVMPVSDTDFDQKLASVVGTKMQTMGYTVRGNIANVGQDLLDAYEYGLNEIDEDRMEAMIDNVDLTTRAAAGRGGASAASAPPKPTAPRQAAESTPPAPEAGDSAPADTPKRQRRKRKPLADEPQGALFDMSQFAKAQRARRMVVYLGPMRAKVGSEEGR